MKNRLEPLIKSRLIFVPIAVIIALLLFYFKSLIIAATVNGEPISRLSVIKELEKQGGKSVLDNLVINSLVLQEAAKEKVTASQDEISAQIAKITSNLKAQGQDLDTALKAQGMTQDDLKKQIKLQIMVQKMAGKDINVSDKEFEDSFNQNKATYPKGSTLESMKDQIKSDLTQQKLSQAVNAWIANLKSNAKINYFVSY